KCNRIFFPFQSDGTVNVRLYQSSFSAPSCFCTPDRLDSTANGTNICPSYICGSAFPIGVIAYSHSPFRLSQSCRSIIGRGYSGNTFSTSMVCAHFVFILSPAGCHCANKVEIPVQNNSVSKY